MDLLREWSFFLNKVRSFFLDRGFYEVSTPLLLSHPNLDPNVEPIEVSLLMGGVKKRMWLQTSPEYSMKKVLAKYRKNIFQICKVFRNSEYGKLHRVEFHMLEWYRVNATFEDLISDLKELLSELNCSNEFDEGTVEEVFRSFTGKDIPSDRDGMKKILRDMDLNFSKDEDWETLFYRIFIEAERKLGWDKPFFLKYFPAKLCALARVTGSHAERFELFIKGVEIANGWTEETDPREVLRRLEVESTKRALPIDQEFIMAHRDMPPCAGCSVGLDRLLMILLGKESLGDIELIEP